MRFCEYLEPRPAKIVEYCNLGVAGREIGIEKEMSLAKALTFIDEGNMAVQNFVNRRDDIVILDPFRFICYYGHVDGLGYIVGEDEIVFSKEEEMVSSEDDEIVPEKEGEMDSNKEDEMKKIETTEQGYYYAKVSNTECINWGGLGVCDLCGKPFIEGYLTFVLGNCICEDCFKDWLSRAKVYEEDLEFQEEVSERWFKNYFGDLVIMPSGYNKSKIAELNKENEDLLSNLDKINAEIDKLSEEVFGMSKEDKDGKEEW